MYKIINDTRKHNEYTKIINSIYFKNLKNKTQLIPFHHKATDRLKHSKMVFLVTKSIYNQLYNKIDIDLYCLLVASLTHDIGHPPFGHDGERALNEMMSLYGGFESNAQTLYILKHELCVDTSIINATFKHLSLIPSSSTSNKLIKGYYAFMHDELKNLRNKRSIEKYIVDISDEISYIYSDICDLFYNVKVVQFSKFRDSFLYKEIIDDLTNNYHSIFSNKEIKEMVNEIEEIVLETRSFTNYIKHMINGVVWDDSLEKILLSPRRIIQLTYLKAVTRESYFNTKEFKENEKKITQILTSAFNYYSQEIDSNKKVTIKDKYRWVCNKLHMQSELSILKLYKELNK